MSWWISKRWLVHHARLTFNFSCYCCLLRGGKQGCVRPINISLKGWTSHAQRLVSSLLLVPPFLSRSRSLTPSERSRGPASKVKGRRQITALRLRVTRSSSPCIVDRHIRRANKGANGPITTRLLFLFFLLLFSSSLSRFPLTGVFPSVFIVLVSVFTYFVVLRFPFSFPFSYPGRSFHLHSCIEIIVVLQ